MPSKPFTATVNSDEINHLIFRYLQESGYVHSAFTFGCESHINKSKIEGSQIPPGALLSFMQRGVNFVEIEESLMNGTTENATGGSAAMDGITSLLDVHESLCRENFKRGGAPPVIHPPRQSNNQERNDDIEIDAGGATNTGSLKKKNMEIPASDTLVLCGHNSEVFVCTWNPKNNFSASASGDSTARIWPVPNEISGAPTSSSLNPIVSHHPEPDPNLPSARNSKANVVTTLSWDPNGKVLATGCYDGCARLWSVVDELQHTLKLHKGSLFSLKWSKTGSHILPGSVDATTAVWNGRTGQLVQQLKFHSAPTLDVDWRNDSTFASCSTDRTIHL